MKVFAHRGASGEAPENSRAAIQIALDLPIFGVEIDVFAFDDDYVITHDRWLTRTTGIARRLNDLTKGELAALSAGECQGHPQSILTLAEVLALGWDEKVLNLELKSIADMQHLHDYIKTHAPDLPSGQILLSSFNHHYLASARQLQLPYERGWLTASLPLQLAATAEDSGSDWISIDMAMLDEALVKDAHARGLKVGVYPVDEEDDLALLLSMQVDAVFANHPGRAAEFIRQNR